jgi:hypothetical protein
LHLSPDASDGERAEWLGQIEEAKDLFKRRGPSSWKQVAPVIGCVEAELRGLLRDPDGALRVLELAIGPEEWTGEPLLVRAHILADAGRITEARQDAERAARLLHPEGQDMVEARQLLSRLGEPG